MESLRSKLALAGVDESGNVDVEQLLKMVDALVDRFVETARSSLFVVEDVEFNRIPPLLQQGRLFTDLMHSHVANGDGTHGPRGQRAPRAPGAVRSVCSKSPGRNKN